MSKPFCKTWGEFAQVLDTSKPVKIYRNLHKKCYSVQQGGRVACHTDEIGLFNCKLKVSKAGRQRVLRERRKNVHAYIVGRISALPQRRQWSTGLRYNPYESENWRSIDFDGERVVTEAAEVTLHRDGKVTYLPKHRGIA